MPLAAQRVPAPDDTRHSLLREAMLGVVPGQATVSATEAARQCVRLPLAPPNDRLQGPHGDSLLTTSCQVVRFVPIGSDPARGWFAAEYGWTSVFTAEDTARGPAARDTVTEAEAVVFASAPAHKIRPEWHARYETGDYAIWRSITPELAPAPDSTLLLSVMSCVNGTGGCSQEFLQRRADGQWIPIWQAWLDELPSGYSDRIRHGARIDPRTLRGAAGFYASNDANCCPGSTLRVRLALQGDSLVLKAQRVVPNPS
jgi:hypothetical protein